MRKEIDPNEPADWEKGNGEDRVPDGAIRHEVADHVELVACRMECNKPRVRTLDVNLNQPDVADTRTDEAPETVLLDPDITKEDRHNEERPRNPRHSLCRNY